MKRMIYCLLLTLTLTLTLSMVSCGVGSLGKDFVSGFLTVIKGTDFKLDDQCFGEDFEIDFKKLIYAINQENSLLVIAIFGKIVNEVNEKCNKNDFIQIYNDTKKMIENKPELANRLIRHTHDFIVTFKSEIIEINKNQFNAKNLGGMFGELINTLVYEKVKPSKDIKTNTALNFLSEYEYPNTFSEEAVEEFVNGFFEGVSSVPIDQNKCSTDIVTVKSGIVKVFTDLFVALKTRTGIVEAIQEVIALTVHLKNLDLNCKFTDLSNDLISLSTKAGITKLALRITTHLPSVLGDVKGTVTNFELKEFRKAGVNFGALTKVTLKYSTI